MKSVVLGTISLDRMAGGLEKNIILLANHLARQGDDVTLVTFDRIHATSFYDIEPSVKWHKVGNTRPHGTIGFVERLRLIGRIRSVLKGVGRPTIICFHHGILSRFYLAALNLGLRLVCSERNSLTLYQHIRQSKWSVGFLMLGLTDKITVQFPGYVPDYPFWLRGRIKVIPNPVSMPQRQARPDMAGKDGRFKLVTVGRLCAQKNQKALIDAFSAISSRFPQWDLHIIGDGDAHDDLTRHVDLKSLRERVFFEGKQRNVSAWLADSNLFCLPSKWEGFPNALAEAMAHGLPCVGFTECAGVRDLIIDGKTGALAKDGDLPDVLASLMASADRRRDMGLASVEIISKFSPENTFQKWDELLANLSGSK